MSRRYDKTNKMACAPSEDSDQPGHPPSLIKSLLSAWKKLGSLATHWAHSKDSDQTGWMPRLIRVFAGRTCHFVGFVMREAMECWSCRALFTRALYSISSLSCSVSQRVNNQIRHHRTQILMTGCRVWSRSTSLTKSWCSGTLQNR